MNAVGVDVFKRKNTVAMLRPTGEVVETPIDVAHEMYCPERLSHQIFSLGEDTRVVIDVIGRYQEPIAQELHEHGIFLCVVNPLIINGL